MELHVINTGYFKLDGGAMFGVVPKVIWQQTNPADENNLCSWAMRSLLVVDGNRKILIDNGIGDKQSKKFFSHYFLHGDDTMEKSLNNAGFSFNDITDNVLTHLHFDHAGGGIKKTADGEGFEPVFPNANFWVTREQWEWATNPNNREKASFLRENLYPMLEHNQLKFIEMEGDLFPNFEIRIFDGHTDGQAIPYIKYKDYTIIFAADLLPSTGHVPLPYLMSYDTRPLITLDEKREFLNEAASEKQIIFFEHDYYTECCTVKKTERGVRVDQKFSLQELMDGKIKI